MDPETGSLDHELMQRPSCAALRERQSLQKSDGFTGCVTREQFCTIYAS